MSYLRLIWLVPALTLFVPGFPSRRCWAQMLDKPALLAKETFWDNRDWDWYERHIPFLDTPDPEINTTWYYRWELLTKHLVYGSPNDGYAFTEFIDRPFWSGEYGAISCPAGHQLYEARWLRDPQIARDYARYWFRVPGAQPRRYSTWLADSLWAVHQVHPDVEFATDLLPDLLRNLQGWRDDHWVPEVGMFWQTGHDDGMEFNINSRQTRDILRGAPGFRPTLNSYLWADMQAIAKIARLAGDGQTAAELENAAQQLKQRLLTWLWDERRQFFFPRYRDEEQDQEFRIARHSMTYQTGRYAGDRHGRELIGYVPWQFNLPDPTTARPVAWQKLMQSDGFRAPFGPTTVERNDPLFLLQDSCCWWSGQSWPYATSQTLKAMANLLQHYRQDVISRDDYLQLLRTYTRTHRKQGLPYLAEAAHPDSGSWRGHDSYNHSEHYFHSGYNDLIITGLAGLIPSDDNVVRVDPLFPATWDYFALDDVPYRGHRLGILWDKTGAHFQRGAGLQLLIDGQVAVSAKSVQVLEVELPVARRATGEADTVPEQDEPRRFVNYAVNNSLEYYPRIQASSTAAGSLPTNAIDGNYWYHLLPPNRWMAESAAGVAETVASTGAASTRASAADGSATRVSATGLSAPGTPEGAPGETYDDWLEIDFGLPRPLRRIVLYFLDDSAPAPIDLVPFDPVLGRQREAADSQVRAPRDYRLECFSDGQWLLIPGQTRRHPQPRGHTANVVEFPERSISRWRLLLSRVPGGVNGLTELEAWGPATLPVPAAPFPASNLAANRDGRGFPQASCSWISRYDAGVQLAIDGKINYRPTPNNRWTSYESPHKEDWLQIDFGAPRTFRQVVLHIYDDHGGVQAPKKYDLQVWHDDAWQTIAEQHKSPSTPVGSQPNRVTFPAVTADKLRIIFTHQDPARSGVTEVEVGE